MSALVLRDVVVRGEDVDIRCEHELITDIAPRRSLEVERGDVVLDGRGRWVLPGLHDHHIHLLATAGAENSLHVGPGEVGSPVELASVLREADRATEPGEWIRAVGYHESVAGDLDREALDAILDHRPVRVQHRSGALWVLNTVACDALGVTDGDRRATGRLWREDEWLREQLPATAPADLGALGAHLARFGVTGLTDATPFTHEDGLRLLSDSGIRQRLMVMGGVNLAGVALPPEVMRGPVKMIVADHDLPSIEDLEVSIVSAHSHRRPVAVHCVSRIALVLALAAWEAAGVRSGDRIEHASVVPSELIGRIAAMGLRVVTQPNFVAERGDEYLSDVDPGEFDDLYRCRNLVDAGIALAAGTDAPFGDPDPWKAIEAAIERRTHQGHVLGASERLSPREALHLFLSPPDRPGDPPRRISVGVHADLVLLGAPLPEVLSDPTSDAVEVTIIGGDVVFERG